MIQKFVDRFMENREWLMGELAKQRIEGYSEIVRLAIEAVTMDDDYDHELPGIGRIHQIDDGDYGGTLVYVIGCNGCQPSQYWYVMISYGSCSVCDTLLALNGHGDGAPTEKQVNGYYTLCLHVIQQLKEMYDEAV